MLPRLLVAFRDERTRILKARFAIFEAM